MVEYTCKRCGYFSKKKYDMSIHLKRKKSCEPILEDISCETLLDEIINVQKITDNKCSYCDNYFSTFGNKRRHENICNKKNKSITKEEISELKSEMITIKEKLQLITNKSERKVINDVLKSEEQTDIIKSNNNYNECIYIIQEREFLSTMVYKIGRTANIKSRCGQYPKGSNLLFVCPVNDYINFESKLIERLINTMEQRTDIGTEYFEGDIDDIINVIYNMRSN
jgi:hypothetical protein